MLNNVVSQFYCFFNAFFVLVELRKDFLKQFVKIARKVFCNVIFCNRTLTNKKLLVIQFTKFHFKQLVYDLFI